MNRVFVLGAGFSHENKVPLARELFQPLLEFGRANFRDELQEFEKILEFARVLTGTPEPDLEQFLTLYSGGWWLWRHVPPNPFDVTTIPTTLTRLLALYMNRFRLDRAGPIKRFAASLVPGDVIITFNWDTLLEQALRQLGRPMSYGVSASKIRLLKLHGSSDWARLYPGRQVPRRAERVRELVYRYPDPEAAMAQHGDRYLPAISLPQASKIHLVDLDRFWVHAYRSLAGARKVIVIGYSMPEADNRAMTLLRSSVADGISQRNGSLRPGVFLISPSRAAAKRLGKVTKRRVVHRDIKFGRWVGSALLFDGDMR